MYNICAGEKAKTFLIPLLVVAIGASWFFFYGSLLVEPAKFIEADSNSYLNFARTFFLNVNPWSGGPFDFFRTPGYPAFLAFFPQSSTTMVILVQLFIWFSCAVYLAHFFNKKFNAPFILLLLFLLFDPTIVFNLTSILSDWLSSLLTVFFIISISSQSEDRVRLFRKGCLAGLIAALNAYVRPASLYLPAFILLVSFIFLRRKSLRMPILISSVVFSLLIAPWYCRNFILTGEPFFSEVSSFNLLYYKVGGLKLIDDGKNISEDAISDLRRELSTGVEGAVNGDARKTIAATINRRTERAIDIAKGASITAYVDLIFRSISRLFLGSSYTRLAELMSSWNELGRVAENIFWCIVAFFALRGIIFSYRLNRDLTIIWCSPIVYFALISIGGETYSRMRIPFIPIHLAFASLGVKVFFARLKAERRKPAIHLVNDA